MTTLLNPIQAQIAQGVNPLVAFLTMSTCGEACWAAREEICRCSCGGKNHGCLRTADGVRPVRSCKLQGYRYELKAVGIEGISKQAADLNHDHLIAHYKLAYHHVAESHDPMWSGLPAKIRLATDDQVTNWPELAAYRVNTYTVVGDAKIRYRKRPDLLWVRVNTTEVQP